MSLLDRRLSRRELLKATVVGTFLAETMLTACSGGQKASVQSQAEKAKAEGKVAESSPEYRIKSEVKRISETVLLKGDSSQIEAAQYYLGKPVSDLRQSYLPLVVRSLSRSRVAFASTQITLASVDESRALLYKPDSGSSLRKPVVTGIDMPIEFSPLWRDNSSDQVKALTMYKEFLHLKIWPVLARAYLQEILSTGRVGLEGNPSQLEQEDTMLLLGFRSQGMKELFDYSAYLLVWPWAKRILEGNASDRRGIEYTDFSKLYNKLKARNLDYNLTLESPDFLHTAFSSDSPWVSVVTEHLQNYPTPTPSR